MEEPSASLRPLEAWMIGGDVAVEFLDGFCGKLFPFRSVFLKPVFLRPVFLRPENLILAIARWCFREF